MPNATGGLIVIAPNVQKVADGYTGRRAIVEDKRCNACHQELGTFTEDAFHAGQRNDGTTCSWCHTPNRASYGWSADSLSFVHATHGAAKRTVPYTWHNNLKYWEVTYPGVLSQCESCHLPGTFDYSAPGSAAALPNKQARTVASGTLTGVNTGPDQTLFTLSPYVTAGLAYGSGFSFSAATGTSTAAAPTTLVTSPMATVCFACHDSTLAQLHITTNGGSLYEARSTALVKTEQCALCHAPGKVADIKVQHSK
jgi:OmcA/MtrC family decaheme c-type cytochrome